MYPKLKLRLFIGQIDGPRIASWIADPEYATFFRNNAVLPSYEECFNYPAWSQNIVMMVEDEKGDTVGMVCGYGLNYRNRSIKSGIIIDKRFQNQKYGHAAHDIWFRYLFERLAFRKIIVENVDEVYTDPYYKVGFQLVGRLKAHCKVKGEYCDEILMECFDDDYKPIVF